LAWVVYAVGCVVGNWHSFNVCKCVHSEYSAALPKPKTDSSSADSPT